MVSLKILPDSLLNAHYTPMTNLGENIYTEHSCTVFHFFEFLIYESLCASWPYPRPVALNLGSTKLLEHVYEWKEGYQPWEGRSWRCTYYSVLEIVLYKKKLFYPKCHRALLRNTVLTSKMCFKASLSDHNLLPVLSGIIPHVT